MNNNYPLIISILQAITALGILTTALSVFFWTRQRDKNDLANQFWTQAQNINMTLFIDVNRAKILERAIYGCVSFSEDDQLIVDAFLFLYLNRIMLGYNGFKRKIISHRDYIDKTTGTLKLICSQSDRIRYILLERGYPRDFAFEMMDRIQSGEVAPPLRHEDITIELLQAKLDAFSRSRSAHIL